MKVKIIIGVIVIVTFGAIAYFMLGGAEEVNISHGKVNDYLIVGKEYQGRYRSKELRGIYDDIKDKMTSGEVEGMMIVVNYKIARDSLENGFIHQFLGVQVANETGGQTPRGFVLKEIEASSAIKAQISAHNLVMPSPEDIEEKITEYALANQLNIVDFALEKYISDRELVVEVPILE